MESQRKQRAMVVLCSLGEKGFAMCYSAEVQADYRSYTRDYGATMSIKEFYEIFYRRRHGEKVTIPKAMEAAFASPTNEGEEQIKSLIAEYEKDQAIKFEQELFEQKKRLADAERKLASKITKTAEEHKRIATDKIPKLMRKLDDIKRVELLPRDSRIFPGNYAPVMVVENGQRVVKPMRYQCRPDGAPAFYDQKFPGTYNARRDNLEGTFWKKLFGFNHGVMVVNKFYENVNRHKAEGRALRDGEAPENVVLEFEPRSREQMLIACLWSRWTGPDGNDLLSFAAITDEPPEEVAAAGHDRCIIQIRPEHVDAWLNPDAKNLAAMYSIFDDRPRPYYEHKWLEAA